MEECNIPENSGFTIVKNSGDSAAMVLDELLPGMIESLPLAVVMYFFLPEKSRLSGNSPASFTVCFC